MADSDAPSLAQNIVRIHPHETHSITTNTSHVFAKADSSLIDDKLSNSSAGNTNQSTSTMNPNDDLWWELPKVENFVDLFSISCSIAVIFGGLIPYIPQYLKIKRSMSSDGFSTYGKQPVNKL